MNKYKLTNGKRVRANNPEDALVRAKIGPIQYSTSYTGRVTPFAIDSKGKAVYARPIVKVDGSGELVTIVTIAIILIILAIIFI